MKKQHLFLFGFLMVTFLLTGNYARAQKDTTFWMTLIEYRVHDVSIFEKNYPTVKAFWLKANAGIEYGRIAHTSESGRIYSAVFFKGPENFGAFMANRLKINNDFSVKEPAISKENLQNINGPITRSNWTRVDSLSNQEPGYKMENFDFRKVQFITVVADKIKEFEANLINQKKLDAAHGINYNISIFKCVDGYSSNTYLFVVPDKSIMDYYKNREARNGKRDQAKNDYAPLRKLMGDLSTVGRIDHLNRVK